MRRSQTDREETWTPEDARRVLDEAARSGESIAAFARRRGLTSARLYWWKQRLATSSLTFLPAAVVPATTARPSVATVSIRVRDGIAIEIADPSPSWVAALVTELARART